MSLHLDTTSVYVDPVAANHHLREVAEFLLAHEPLFPYSERELEKWREMYPQNYRIAFARTADGTAVGLALTNYKSWNRSATAPRSEIYAPVPEHADVTRTALARDLAQWTLQLDADVAELEIAAFDDDEAARAWLKQHDFREVERDNFVELDVRSFNPQQHHRSLPDGVVMTTLEQRPDLLRAVYDVMSEALPDIPSSEPITEAMPYDDWTRMRLGSDTHDASGWFLALDGDTLAGFALLERSATQRTVAWNQFTAIARAYRGQGIAWALKVAAVDWARTRGLQRLRTENEARNVAMRHINDQMGYTALPSVAIWRGPITAVR